MSGYRTIPTKDTFDVEERLGGLVTIKQLAFFILAIVLTYLAYQVLSQLLSSSDAFAVSALVFLSSVGFILANLDKWLLLRLRYYILTDQSALEKHPELLRNIRSVEEDKLVTLDGRVMALLKVTPINFPLLSDEAKEARIGAYETYLRQLVYPIMHMVQSDSVQPEEYFTSLLKSAQAASKQKQGSAGLNPYAAAHVKFVREFLLSSRARTKNHYVVLQVQDPRYKGLGAPSLQPGFLEEATMRSRALLTEFQLPSFFTGGALFVKPANYVLLDLAGRRLVFKESSQLPSPLPARCTRVGLVLQFESKVAMLRFAKGQEGRYYYGPVDLGLMLQKEFMDLPLLQREKEFSVDERRRNVPVSGGKTRWAYDEVEKHIAVLSDKLEATGLRVQRVRGEEIYAGRHTSLMQATKVKVTPKNIKVDNTYYKVVYATGYPYQVNLGWLSNIVDGREDYDLTMYVYPVSIPEALSTFRGAILKLSTEKKARADFLDPETEQHLEDVKSFFTQIVSGKEKYFLASLYITCKAPTPKALDTVLEKCKSDLAGASIDYEVADYDMAKAVYATRLTGSDLPAKRREFPSSSLAATFPHISSSMEIDPEGMFFAFDWMNAPVIMDLRKLPNQHIAITGESGSGKSYFAKSLIPRYLINGYRVFVTDPDGEYIDLAGHFDGTVSTVGPKGSAINPFDLEGREVNDKIRSLLGLMAIITGSMTKYQEGLVADALAELFKASGKRGKAPTFSDFAAVLSSHLRASRDEQMKHDLQFMLIAIRPFLRGQLYGFVDAQTSVKLGARLQVFDLRAYQNDKTLRDFFNYLIFDYISHQLLSDKTPKALLMDEGWTMVNYPSSEDYVRYIIKDSRKYNVSFVFITQELEDMLSSQAGRSILNNTATQFIFHQKDSAMALMRTTMNLTHEENEKLLSCGKGEGLMISEPYRLLFRVHTSPAEHAIISTDPNEPHVALAKGGVRRKVPVSAGVGVGQPVWKQIEAAEPAAQKAPAAALASGSKAEETDEKEVLRKGLAEAAKQVDEAAEKDAAPAAKAEVKRMADAEQALPDALPRRPAALPIALSHGLVSAKDAQLLRLGVERAKARAKEAAKKGPAGAAEGSAAPAREKTQRTPRRKAAKPVTVRRARPRPKPKAVRPKAAKKAKAAKKPAAKKPASSGGFSITFVEKN